MDIIAGIDILDLPESWHKTVKVEISKTFKILQNFRNLILEFGKSLMGGHKF